MGLHLQCTPILRQVLVLLRTFLVRDSNSSDYSVLGSTVDTPVEAASFLELHPISWCEQFVVEELVRTIHKNLT